MGATWSPARPQCPQCPCCPWPGPAVPGPLSGPWAQDEPGAPEGASPSWGHHGDLPIPGATMGTSPSCPCPHPRAAPRCPRRDRARNTGVIACTVCLEEFQTPITYLSEPVDVYSDWIDACEAANQ
uniref:Transcription elongation factor 1 homolog n=1 Tax=Nothoprocta perdicaria TaxID=30464 RepID=A0A8C6YKW8_NOTPE